MRSPFCWRLTQRRLGVLQMLCTTRTLHSRETRGHRGETRGHGGGGGGRKRREESVPGAEDTLETRAETNLVCISPNRNPKGTGETEVCQLDLSHVVDEQVLRFQVSVQYPVRMAECHPKEQLVKITLQNRMSVDRDEKRREKKKVKRRGKKKSRVRRIQRFPSLINCELEILLRYGRSSRVL